MITINLSKEAVEEVLKALRFRRDLNLGKAMAENNDAMKRHALMLKFEFSRHVVGQFEYAIQGRYPVTDRPYDRQQLGVIPELTSEAKELRKLEADSVALQEQIEGFYELTARVALTDVQLKSLLAHLGYAKSHYQFEKRAIQCEDAIALSNAIVRQCFGTETLLNPTSNTDETAGPIPAVPQEPCCKNPTAPGPATS